MRDDMPRPIHLDAPRVSSSHVSSRTDYNRTWLWLSGVAVGAVASPIVYHLVGVL